MALTIVCHVINHGSGSVRSASGRTLRLCRSARNSFCLELARVHSDRNIPIQVYRCVTASGCGFAFVSAARAASPSCRMESAAKKVSLDRLPVSRIRVVEKHPHNDGRMQANTRLLPNNKQIHVTQE